MKNYKIFAFTTSLILHVVMLLAFSLDFNNKRSVNNIKISILPKEFIVRKDLAISDQNKKSDPPQSHNNIPKIKKLQNDASLKQKKKIEAVSNKINQSSTSKSVNETKKIVSPVPKQHSNSSKSKVPPPSKRALTSNTQPITKKKQNVNDNTNTKSSQKVKPQLTQNASKDNKKKTEVIDYKEDLISSTLRSLEETNLSNHVGKQVKNFQTTLDPKSIIKAKIEENWFHQVNLDQNNITIEILIRVIIDRDKKISNVKIKDVKCSADQEICNILVESAVKAIFFASPIQELDENDYHLWKDFELLFNPSNN